MTQENLTRSIVSWTKSIYARCILITTTVTLITVAVLSYQNARTSAEIARDGVETLAETATSNTAGRLGSAIRFGNADELVNQMTDLIAASDGLAEAGLILSSEGEVLAQVGNDSGTNSRLFTTAQSALTASTSENLQEGLIFAYPVGFGQNGTVVGVLAVGWTDRPIMETVNGQRQLQLLFAFVLFVVMLSCATLLLYRILGRPLSRIESSMKTVALGDYETQIPDRDREDEFGRLALNLDQMRQGLGEAAKAAALASADQAEQREVIGHLTFALRKLADGNMTTRINEAFAEKYQQLKDDFNNTASTLHDTLQAIVEKAQHMQAEADGIGQQSGELSQRTEIQAATLEETAAALDELTGNVKVAAEGAKEVDEIVRQTRREADDSGRIVGETVTAMSAIESSSQQIATIISVIDDIAFQTNLLALNAGVEAARAGEAGRGFAVVASEVRELAQRSSEAAQQIKDLIGSSTEEVERGVKLVDETGAALTAITERVINISSLMSEMADGATEQSHGLAEINLGVGQLDKVTQQNASMVETANVASQSLRQQAAALNDIVSAFNIAGSPQHESRFAA